MSTYVHIFLYIQRSASDHAPALRADRMTEGSRNVVKHHVDVGRREGNVCPDSFAAWCGGRRTFVEVTVLRRDLWARLAWVSPGLEALAMEVSRQPKVGWMRTQAEKFGEADREGRETGGGCGILSGIWTDLLKGRPRSKLVGCRSGERRLLAARKPFALGKLWAGGTRSTHPAWTPPPACQTLRRALRGRPSHPSIHSIMFSRTCSR